MEVPGTGRVALAENRRTPAGWDAPTGLATAAGSWGLYQTLRVTELSLTESIAVGNFFF